MRMPVSRRLVRGHLHERVSVERRDWNLSADEGLDVGE
jgi:hypothetical protein